jgi:hypothetical protein
MSLDHIARALINPASAGRTIIWPMLPGDLDAVLRIQVLAYQPHLREGRAVFTEKLTLFPSGCWIGQALARTALASAVRMGFHRVMLTAVQGSMGVLDGPWQDPPSNAQ